MIDRLQPNEDIINYIFCISEALISNLRIVKEKDKKELISEAKKFILSDVKK